MPRAAKNHNVKVKVTAGVIATAVPADSSHCMIADALALALPDATRIAVDLATIRWSDPTVGKRFIALTPRSAQLALLDFDNGRHPEPFEITVSPSQIVKIRTNRQRGHEKPKLQSNRGHAPVVEGGQPPPIGPGASGAHVRTGKRRAFGLKGLGR